MKPANDDRIQPAPEARVGERLYAWIARTLRERIANGVYPVGTPLPAEDRLGEEFAVSRSTIRQALRELQGDGLIASRKGSGSVVLPAPAADTQILHATSIDDLLAFSRGHRFHIEAIGVDTIGNELATRAGVPQGSRWLMLKGFGKSEGYDLPDCWAEYYVHEDYAAIGRLLSNPVTSSVFQLIEKRFGIRIVEVRQEMSAATVTPAQAAVLHVEPGTAAITVQRVYTTSSGAVAQITVAVHPAHRFRHSITLHRA